MAAELIQNVNRTSEHGLSPLASSILHASDFTADQIDELLNGPADIQPSHAPCIMQARDRILKAKKNGEKVFVGGDYDADGLTSTAIMKCTLDILGIPNGYYIPNREKDGYGLKPEIVNMAIARGYTLFITVDNGVSAFDAINAVHAAGLEIIVTDHHLIGEDPHADILVHPDYLEPEAKTLSGAGVALLLAMSLLPGDLSSLKLLAGVAQISDVMPMWGDARALVKRAIKTGPDEVPLLQLLTGSAKTFDEDTIGYQIAPRLNSIGRMNDPAMTVNAMPKILLSYDPTVTLKAASVIESINSARKNITAQMLEKAEKIAKPGDGIMVIYDPDIPSGVCGVVAGHMVSEFRKPAIVLTGKGTVTGSARSVPGFDIKGYLDGWNKFVAFGGHEMAAGMSLKEEDVPAFTEFCSKAVVTDTGTGEKALAVDPADVTVASIEELNKLRPFPKEMVSTIALPWMSGTQVKEYAKVTKVCLPNGIEGIFFPTSGVKIPKEPKWMIGHLSINEWNGNKTPQMLVNDIL